MQGAALSIAFVYWIVSVIDPTLLSWQCLNRPIVVAPLAGLVLGDLRTGLIMGAALESVFMGISAIGGSIAADPTIGTLIAVSYTILTGADIETGLALSLPMGTAITAFGGVLRPLYDSLSAYWERLATTNIKQFRIQVMAYAIFITPLINCIILYVAIAFGVEGLNGFLGSLPPQVMAGIGAATGMMFTVGFAILTSMIWSNEVGVFFFVGYVMTKFLGLGSLPIAIFGAAIAITMFFGEKRSIDLKKSLQSSSNGVNAEEDFF